MNAEHRLDDSMFGKDGEDDVPPSTALSRNRAQLGEAPYIRKTTIYGPNKFIQSTLEDRRPRGVFTSVNRDLTSGSAALKRAPLPRLKWRGGAGDTSRQEEAP